MRGGEDVEDTLAENNVKLHVRETICQHKENHGDEEGCQVRYLRKVTE